jgi:uncharacterized membrane protein
MSVLRPLVLAASVGAGVSGGVLFGFSTFVMPALRRLPAAEGIAAMQQINLKAPNPLFMLALFGSAVACLVIGGVAVNRLTETGSRYLAAGSVTYLAGALITIVYHVPQNNRLAPLDPTLPASTEFWGDYARSWVAWNHLRTLLSIAGSVLLSLGWRHL